jgi:prepilin-type N-terminal cleavage/methylation domain-containing protein
MNPDRIGSGGLPGGFSGGPQGQRGFSLIEILVGAIVVALLATSAFYFLNSQNGMSQAGNDLIKGVNLGKLKMDSLKVTPYDELSAGSDTVMARYIRSWRVTVMRDGAGIPTGRKKIEINVIWPLTADHTVTMATLKSDDLYKEATP